VRLTDADRCRLARAGQRLGRRQLRQVATIVTPDTILRWHLHDGGLDVAGIGFMRQVGRTLAAVDEGVLVGHRVLICDRDAKWSAPVRARLGEAGIRVVQTPYQAPNANACVAGRSRTCEPWKPRSRVT
jgi:hypothetical protein